MLDLAPDRKPPGHKKLIPWNLHHRIHVANQFVDQIDLILEPSDALQRTNWLRLRFDVLAGGFLCCRLFRLLWL
jgi:hypothetical protein